MKINRHRQQSAIVKSRGNARQRVTCNNDSLLDIQNQNTSKIKLEDNENRRGISAQGPRKPIDIKISQNRTPRRDLSNSGMSPHDTTMVTTNVNNSRTRIN